MILVESQRREQIARQVQEALDRHQPRDYRVTVDAGAILQDEDWLHVVVKSPDDVRDRDFYEALARAESELNAQDPDRNYLLVPAIAE